jgi:hypothetical protein
MDTDEHSYNPKRLFKLGKSLSKGRQGRKSQKCTNQPKHGLSMGWAIGGRFHFGDFQEARPASRKGDEYAGCKPVPGGMMMRLG